MQKIYIWDENSGILPFGGKESYMSVYIFHHVSSTRFTCGPNKERNDLLQNYQLFSDFCYFSKMSPSIQYIKKIPWLFPDFLFFFQIFPDFSRFSLTFFKKALFSRFSRFSLTAGNPANYNFIILITFKWYKQSVRKIEFWKPSLLNFLFEPL